MFNHVIEFIRSLYPNNSVISLHEPRFLGREKKYIIDAIDSSFVSSIGEYVNRFEEMICEITGANYAIATVNGTSALHTALQVAGVGSGDEVITQPLSFVATANAISYCNASPVFLDIERKTLGLDPASLELFFKKNTKIKDNKSYNSSTGKRIAACVPVHVFGMPCDIRTIADICDHYHVPLVEDAAESLGSLYKGKHTGTFGHLGIFSLNGNKIVTSGGGGAIITNDKAAALEAKHLTTTAKTNHSYRYVHDVIGYNYRLPNLNAAMACAQLEQLTFFLDNKRELAEVYKNFFNDSDIFFISEPPEARSNYWLNSIVLPDKTHQDIFLKETNGSGIMTRPPWDLLSALDMYRSCQTGPLSNAIWAADRIINLPSSVRL